VNARSNLAYHHDYATTYPSATPQTSNNLRIKVSKKQNRADARRAGFIGVSKIMLVVSLAFVVLLRGVMLTDKTATVEKKQAELQALIASNEKLQVEIDSALDLDKVEDIARNELGMHPAEKNQTIYINLEQVDYVERVAGSHFSLFDGMKSFLAGLVAYFD